MAKTLDADLNIIQRSGINIQIDPLTKDLNIIQALDDEPNDVGGLSAQQLKAKFDESGNLIKTYINESLIPQVLSEGATEAQRQANETQRQENEQTRQENETARVQAEAARQQAAAQLSQDLSNSVNQLEEDFEAAEAARNVWEDYDPAKAYVPGNKVYWAGSSYVNKAPCTGVYPNVEAYWQMVAKRGETVGGGMTEEDCDERYLKLSGGSMTGSIKAPDPVFTGSISMGRKAGTKVGPESVAVGLNVSATANWSYAEGRYTTANFFGSHAEGESSVANALNAHAEGEGTYTNQPCGSHVEGICCIIDSLNAYLPIKSFSGTTLIAENNEVVSDIDVRLSKLKEGDVLYLWNDADNSTPYRMTNTVVSVDVPARMITLKNPQTESNPVKIAINANLTTMSSGGTPSHAEGRLCMGLGPSCHAEGTNTIAKGTGSHAEGSRTIASALFSHAEGRGTIAAAYSQHAGGKYNVKSTLDADKVIIGKGTGETSRANCFRVTDTGVYASGSYHATGADYAELFEWADGNPDGEDPPRGAGGPLHPGRRLRESLRHRRRP